jgi:hypothetical protein
MSLLVNASLATLSNNDKVNIEGPLVSCYVDLLYGVKPNIIFDKKTKMLRQSFWEKYGISNEGLTPKKLKIKKEIKEDKVVALFGPYGCNY